VRWDCRRWAQERPAPSLLLRTDPSVGLATEHVDELLRWASLRPPA